MVTKSRGHVDAKPTVTQHHLVTTSSAAAPALTSAMVNTRLPVVTSSFAMTTSCSPVLLSS